MTNGSAKWTGKGRRTFRLSCYRKRRKNRKRKDRKCSTSVWKMPKKLRICECNSDCNSFSMAEENFIRGSCKEKGRKIIPNNLHVFFISSVFLQRNFYLLRTFLFVISVTLLPAAWVVPKGTLKITGKWSLKRREEFIHWIFNDIAELRITFVQFPINSLPFTIHVT